MNRLIYIHHIITVLNLEKLGFKLIIIIITITYDLQTSKYLTLPNELDRLRSGIYLLDKETLYQLSY